MDDYFISRMIDSFHGELDNCKIVPIRPNCLEYSLNIHAKGIKINFTDTVTVFLCNSGHPAFLKDLKLKYSGYKVRIINKNPVLMRGNRQICNFLEVPVQKSVIYWVSYQAKNHPSLKNRSDVFCLYNGEITNKILVKRSKYNKKHQLPS